MKVDPIKKPDYSAEVVGGGDRPMKEEQPKVHICVPRELMKGLTIGAEATVIIKGTLSELELKESEDNENEYGNRSEISISMTDVEVKTSGVDNKGAVPPETENEFTALVEEE